MRELLFTISELTQVINVSVLFVLIAFSKRQSGFIVALSAICLLDGLGIYVEPKMLHYASLGNEQAQIIKLVWYPFYFVTNTIAILAIVSIFIRNHYRWDFYSRSVVTALLLLSFVQLARFADRLVFDSNLLAELYRYAIPVLNVGISVIVLSYAYSLFFDEENEDGNQGE